MKLSVFVIIVLLWMSCSTKESEYPNVAIETKYGDIVVELYPDKAPKTVAAFLNYIDSGIYNRSTFYRVLNRDNQPSDALKSELIQGGIWRTNAKKAAALRGIPHESTKQTGLQHLRGSLSMARLEPGTAGSEFFICLKKEPGLDYGGENIGDGQGYAVFGRVVKGMEIVEKIYRQREDDQYFDPPVFIFGIKRL
jgi:peptidyl-prolyl cis-trans isomerase A (cyclophilin A)